MGTAAWLDGILAVDNLGQGKGADTRRCHAGVGKIHKNTLLLNAPAVYLAHPVNLEQLVAHGVGRVLELPIRETVAGYGNEHTEHVAEFVVDDRGARPGREARRRIRDLVAQLLPYGLHLFDTVVELHRDNGQPGHGLGGNHLHIAEFADLFLKFVRDQLFHTLGGRAWKLGDDNGLTDGKIRVLTLGNVDEGQQTAQADNEKNGQRGPGIFDAPRGKIHG